MQKDRCEFPYQLPCLAHTDVVAGRLDPCPVCAEVLGITLTEPDVHSPGPWRRVPFYVYEDGTVLMWLILSADFEDGKGAVGCIGAPNRGVENKPSPEEALANALICENALDMRTALISLRDADHYENAAMSGDDKRMVSIEARYRTANFVKIRDLQERVTAFKQLAEDQRDSALNRTGGIPS